MWKKIHPKSEKVAQILTLKDYKKKKVADCLGIGVDGLRKKVEIGSWTIDDMVNLSRLTGIDYQELFDLELFGSISDN